MLAWASIDLGWHCSANGDWRSALGIRLRMQSLGCTRSVHVYNALLAVCEHYDQWDQVTLHTTFFPFTEPC